MKTILTFFLGACTFVAHAQQGTATYLGNDVDRVLLETASRIGERVEMNRKGPEETEKGTYYLDTEFQPTVVTLSNNKTYANVSSRYDALHDVLEIQHLGKVYVLEGQKINKLVVNPQSSDSARYIHARFVQGEARHGFYKVVVDGKKSLLKYTEVFVKKPDYVVQFNAGSKVTTYSLLPKFYLWNEDKTAVPLKSTRKGVLTALGSHKDEVDSYLDRTDGKLSDENTLKAVFQYYNTL